MNAFLRTGEFDAWLAALKDRMGRARIAHRIRSAEHGNFGDCEPVGEGVSEMRVHVGPGYRIYYTRRLPASAGRGQGFAKARHPARHNHGARTEQGVKTMVKLAPFDAADYLDSEETIAEYLSAALEDPKPWFYAGLFSLATAEETAPFLAALHRLQQIGVRPIGKFQVQREWRIEIGQGFKGKGNAVIAFSGQTQEFFAGHDQPRGLRV